MTKPIKTKAEGEKINKWDIEKLRHLISEVYHANEEPHSSSAVIDGTTVFLNELHLKELANQKKEMIERIEKKKRNKESYPLDPMLGSGEIELQDKTYNQALDDIIQTIKSKRKEVKTDA